MLSPLLNIVSKQYTDFEQIFCCKNTFKIVFDTCPKIGLKLQDNYIYFLLGYLSKFR